MTGIPMDEVNRLWDAMGSNHSWTWLRDVLIAERNAAPHADHRRLDALIRKADVYTADHAAFPRDAEQLARELSGHA